MGPLAIILALELVLTGSIISLSSHPQDINPIKHNVSNVLGIHIIAQVDTPTPDSTDTPTPQPNDNSSSSPNPTEAAADTPTPQFFNNINDTPTQEATPTSADQNLPSNTLISPTLDQFDNSPSSDNTFTGQSETASPQSSIIEITPTLTVTPQEQASKASVLTNGEFTVLDPSSVLSNSDNVGQNVINLAQEQIQQISHATTPQAQVQVSINSGQQDLQFINTALKQDDFANISFLTQNLSQHLDQSLNAIKQTSPKQAAKLKTQLNNFCTLADTTLRSSEEMVPEESEQDIELDRAKCLNLVNP